MQEQARLSNLLFPDTNKDEIPQWKSDSWPPLMGGYSWFPASVVVNGNKKEEQTVVVIGGHTGKDGTNSVLLMDLDKDMKQWRKGPSLNQNRCGHGAVVCNGFVYTMGGYCNYQRLDSIERIDLLDLLKSPCTVNENMYWTPLKCTLSTPRAACQAAVVHNRFIVVVGGYYLLAVASLSLVATMKVPI